MVAGNWTAVHSSSKLNFFPPKREYEIAKLPTRWSIYIQILQKFHLSAPFHGLAGHLLVRPHLEVIDLSLNQKPRIWTKFRALSIFVVWKNYSQWGHVCKIEALVGEINKTMSSVRQIWECLSVDTIGCSVDKILKGLSIRKQLRTISFSSSH